MKRQFVLAALAVCLLAPFAHANLMVIPWLSGTFTDHEYEIGGVSFDGKRGFDLKVGESEPEMFNSLILGTIFDETTLAVEGHFIGVFTHGGFGHDPEGDFDFAGKWNPSGLITIGHGMGDGDSDDVGEVAAMTITTFSPEPGTLLLLGSGIIAGLKWYKSFIGRN